MRSTSKSSNCISAIVPVASWASAWSTPSLVRALVAEERPDALDGIEVAMVLDGPDGSAVDERLVNGEVQPVIRALHARPVEWTLAALSRDTAAVRAAGGRPVRALPEKKQFDTLVGGRLERLRPPGGGTSVAPDLLSPALENGGLLLDAPALEHRGGQL